MTEVFTIYSTYKALAAAFNLVANIQIQQQTNAWFTDP